ncbi:RAD54 [Mytilus edulis]|uniref:RAD54L n=1 Tax=Mytilus edulis TaxID=6550 RepID=A0A8S3PRE1_MYTED|nr:RAD54 [Mytilus edulis]
MTLRYRCFALRLLKMAAAFKKFRSEDILSLYKSAYNTKIPWKEVFEEETENYFSIFEKATNCSRSLVLSSVLSLTSTLCGPNTKVTVGDNSYSTVLNQYIVAVCAPGGGKTNTYYKVIDPVVEKIKEKHGIAIQLEAYTTAGLQKHQLNNQGYGIITCDEGHRFLSSVNVKQSKGEGERSLLCKMWGGKGDSSILVTGTRGFSKTSMSCCLFIQPQPLLSELCQLGGDDGLMDRFLFCVAKPVFNTTAITKANVPLLRDTKLQSFENVMNNIYEEHLAGKHYKLSADAESVFDGLIDSYSDYMNAKYGSDHEEDKENETPNLNISLDESEMMTSKDTIHILRLAAVLHVFQHSFSCGLNDGCYTPTPLEITKSRLKQAMVLYNSLSQQKSLFVQAIASCDRDTPALHLKPVATFRDRVAKAMCKSFELEMLQQNGFGTLKTIKTRHGKRNFFFKIPGNCIDMEIGAHSTIIKSVGINIDTYESTFNDLSTLTDEEKNFTIQHHPHAEGIEGLW